MAKNSDRPSRVWASDETSATRLSHNAFSSTISDTPPLLKIAGCQFVYCQSSSCTLQGHVDPCASSSFEGQCRIRGCNERMRQMVAAFRENCQWFLSPSQSDIDYRTLFLDEISRSCVEPVTVLTLVHKPNSEYNCPANHPSIWVARDYLSWFISWEEMPSYPNE